MTDKPKIQLTDEQRQQLKAAVIATARDMINRREELSDQANTARQIWQALAQAPTWSIVHVEQPEDGPLPDENWSVTPTVIKK